MANESPKRFAFRQEFQQKTIRNTMNVGSPNASKLAAFLLRDKPLSDEEWTSLLAQVRSLINPLLDKMSLARLGDTPMPTAMPVKEEGVLYLKTTCEDWELESDTPIFETDGVFTPTLADTKGIFFARVMQRRILPMDISITIHGLTRKGEWFVGETEVSQILMEDRRLDVRVQKVRGTLFDSDASFLRSVVHQYIYWRQELALMLDGIRQEIKIELQRREGLVAQMRNVTNPLEFYVEALQNAHK
jgi:hypothetical protein